MLKKTFTQISPLVFPVWRLENGQRTAKRLENTTGYVKGFYFVSKAHKNNSNCYTYIPMLSGLTFSMHIIFTSPGFAGTPEINMADKKAKAVLVWQVLLASYRRKSVIVGLYICLGDVEDTA